MTRLNLGCGKIIFPWTAELQAAAHPLLVVPESAYAPDWVNVDHLQMPGVDEAVDLFAYPWPWADNSVEEIWASHLIEHIPHVPRGADRSHDYARYRLLEHLDGFYAFFAEAWRVLKPGGIIGVAAPYGKSDGALQDPQHTRSIVESTFHYLGGFNMQSPTYDYQLPFAFRATALNFRLSPPFAGLTGDALSSAIHYGWNVADQIQCTLVAVKDSAEPNPNLAWEVARG